MSSWNCNSSKLSSLCYFPDHPFNQLQCVHGPKAPRARTAPMRLSGRRAAVQQAFGPLAPCARIVVTSDGWGHRWGNPGASPAPSPRPDSAATCFGGWPPCSSLCVGTNSSIPDTGGEARMGPPFRLRFLRSMDKRERHRRIFTAWAGSRMRRFWGFPSRSGFSPAAGERRWPPRGRRRWR